MLRCCSARQAYATIWIPSSVTSSQPRTLSFRMAGQERARARSPRSVTSHFPMSRERRRVEQHSDTASRPRSLTRSHPRRFRYLISNKEIVEDRA